VRIMKTQIALIVIVFMFIMYWIWSSWNIKYLKKQVAAKTEEKSYLYELQEPREITGIYIGARGEVVNLFLKRTDGLTDEVIPEG
jgi:hypothetical protein